MIEIKFHPSAASISIFQNRGAQIVSALLTTTDRLMIELQSYIVRSKLSGNPLHRVTGVLASSVHAVPTRIEGEKIIGEVQAGAGPSNVYAWTHERGGAGPFDIVPVRARVLRFLRDGQEVFARAVHHPALPQRSFAESSLHEMKEAVVGAIQETFREAVGSGD